MLTCLFCGGNLFLRRDCYRPLPLVVRARYRGVPLPHAHQHSKQTVFRLTVMRFLCFQPLFVWDRPSTRIRESSTGFCMPRRLNGLHSSDWQPEILGLPIKISSDDGVTSILTMLYSLKGNWGLFFIAFNFELCGRGKNGIWTQIGHINFLRTYCIIVRFSLTFKGPNLEFF